MKNTILALAAFAAAAASAEFKEVPSMPLAARMGLKTFVETIPCEVGNYDVEFVFGDSAKQTTSWVKFEGRRVALEKIETAPGETKTVAFTARVKGPIANEKNTSPKGVTKEAPFPYALNITVATTMDRAPAMKVSPNPDAPVIYLCGDSTVTDQQAEPWGSWGQCLPCFFGRGVAVSNFAKNGLSTETFMSQGRLKRILEHLKPGDFVLVQFGHNDQKKASLRPGEGYDKNLNFFIDQVQAKGAKIVIVSSMERLRYDEATGKQQPKTLAEYEKAAREVAAARNVPYINLNDASYRMYGALGAEGSKRLLCTYSVAEQQRDFFTGGKIRALNDKTHHSIYGAYVLAHYIADELAGRFPELAALRRPGKTPVDPDHPENDPAIPPTGMVDTTRPEGDR